MVKVIARLGSKIHLIKHTAKKFAVLLVPWFKVVLRLIEPAHFPTKRQQVVAETVLCGDPAKKSNVFARLRRRARACQDGAGPGWHRKAHLSAHSGLRDNGQKFVILVHGPNNVRFAQLVVTLPRRGEIFRILHIPHRPVSLLSSGASRSLLIVSRHRLRLASAAEDAASFFKNIHQLQGGIVQDRDCTARLEVHLHQEFEGQRPELV